MNAEIRALASSSAGNCYHLTDGRTPLLLEAGIPFRRIRQGVGFGVSQLAGCLVSHEHLDHCKAIPEMLKAGVDCYLHLDTAKALGVNGHHRAKIIKPLKQFELGTWTILPFDTVHDVDCLGFLLVSQAGARVLYLTDTPYCKYKFRNLTHILIEANFEFDILRESVARGDISVAHKNRVMRSHMSLETLKGFLAANDLTQVEEIWLLHLSDGNSDAERFKREIQAATGKPVYVAES